MPSAWSCFASLCIRSIASSRASYRACVKFESSTFCPTFFIAFHIDWCATW